MNWEWELVPSSDFIIGMEVQDAEVVVIQKD